MQVWTTLASSYFIAHIYYKLVRALRIFRYIPLSDYILFKSYRGAASGEKGETILKNGFGISTQKINIGAAEKVFEWQRRNSF